MTTIFLTLIILVFSGLVSAQGLPAESGNGTEIQEVNTSLSIDDIGTSKDYPVCHRMKNGVVKLQIQTATAE